MPQPIAKWNPARDVWESDQACLCGHSDVYSETFPTSGMTVAGTAYGLPTLVPRTDDSACSLLPTPMAQEPGGTAEQYRERWAKSDGRESTFLPLSLLVACFPLPERQMELRGARTSAARLAT